MAGTISLGRKQPKLARIGGGGRRRAFVVGAGTRTGTGDGHEGGGREKTARRVWRERVLGRAAWRHDREAMAHDEDFIENVDGDDSNASGIDDDDDDDDDDGHIASDASSRSSDDEGAGGGGFSWKSKARETAVRAVANRVGSLLPPPRAATLLGYEEVATNFWLHPDGTRRLVEANEAEHLPADVDTLDYGTLRAFDTGDVCKGWGVCCTDSIRKGQVVGEAVGQCLTEAEFAQLENKSYVFGFDDEMLLRKRRARDEVRYIDLREYGNMMRLINDNTEAPNLQLFYWPPPPSKAACGPLPRRFFLMAKSNITPLTELSWDYGEMYVRPWLVGGDSDSDDDDGSDLTDDDLEWQQVNWAQCDACNKWRKLPCGPDYCDEALPDQWYCHLNAATHTHTCDAPEDAMEADEVWEGEPGEGGAATAAAASASRAEGLVGRPTALVDASHSRPSIMASSSMTSLAQRAVGVGPEHQVEALPICAGGRDGPEVASSEEAHPPAEPQPISHKEMAIEAAQATARLLTLAALPEQIQMRASAPSGGCVPPWADFAHTDANSEAGGQTAPLPQPPPSRTLSSTARDSIEAPGKQAPMLPIGSQAASSKKSDRAPTPPGVAPPIATPAPTVVIRPEATSTSAWVAMLKMKKANQRQ